MFFLALTVLCGCGGNPQVGRLSKDDVILAFGDSLTHGSGADEKQSYPAILQNLIGLEVVNAGMPGELSEEGLERLPEMLKLYDPSLVILCHGGNDILSGRPDEKVADNLRAMIQLCRAHRADVILVGVPKPKLFNMKAAAFYEVVAEELQVPIERQVLPKVLKNSKWKSDRIHPNAEGYRMMAEAIVRTMKRSGALSW